ncbi:T9SS type A sorting domain-containing protein [Flavobacteriaceae bacterium SZ-1-7]|uniref:T9SS type A sorting domain-containing protein n=1 Tax=Tamlana sedimenti TaxID=3134126 RepID=UPI003126B80A
MKSIKIIVVLFLWVSFNLVHSQSNGPVVFDFGLDVSNYGVECSSVLPAEHEGIAFGITGDIVKNETYCTTGSYFAFWAELPEGNYRVKVAVGSEIEASNTTIKAESRRLMVYNHDTPAGVIDTLEFIVSRRSPIINTGGSISLKTGESGRLNWDGYLSLEFTGYYPCIRSLSIEEVDVPTIFLAGDSTVVDQENDPWTSWGQIFPIFLKPEVVVANYAESGESLLSFQGEKRLKKIESQIKMGDYLFSEFAHNDQKSGWTYVEPYTTYQENLMVFANVALNVEATPVFVTSTNRRSFDSNGNIINTLGDYPDAMRQLAGSQNITLFDLNAMSKDLFEALGVTGSKNAFVHYPANYFPWGNTSFSDNTHFNMYGAWQLAKCVVEAIRVSNSPLKNFLRDDVQPYDANVPDLFESLVWPIHSASKISLSGSLTNECVIEDALKITDINGKIEVSFYPNPADGLISFQTEDIQLVEILSVDGKLLINKSMDNQEGLDVSSLPQGIYILRIRTDVGIGVGRLVKR